MALSSLKKPKKQLFSSKVTRAGALIEESRLLLSHWNQYVSSDANLELFASENILAKSSRLRVKHILMSFRQRCVQSEEQARALAIIAKSDVNSSVIKSLLFFHTLHTDPLLRALVMETLPPLRLVRKQQVSKQDIEPAIREWVLDGRTTDRWSASTIQAIAVASLAALRDFGVLQGRDIKTWARPELPLEAFAYIAFLMQREEPSGKQIMESPIWRIWNLQRENVEVFFIEAHTRKWLDYQAAGTVVRLEFPTKSLEEYAHIITR